MMVRFENPVNGIVINVVCNIYVKNVKSNVVDSIGSVGFALLVD